MNRTSLYSFLLVLGFFSLGLAPSIAMAAEKPAMGQPEIVVAQPSTKERVKTLREERFEQMPYLDRGFVRSVINPKNVQNSDAFLSGTSKNLTEILQRSVQVYTPAQAARERIALSKTRILTAVRSLFPEATFIYETRNGDLSGAPYTAESARVNMRQPVFRGGILWNTLLKEKANLEAAQKEYDAVLSDLKLDVSTAFFGYYRAVQVLADHENIENDLSRYATISKQKFEEDIISEIEHLNVESLASQVRYDLETAKQEMEIAKLELQKYLDLELDQNISVAPLYQLENLLKSDAVESEKASEVPEKGEMEFKGSLEIPDLTELVDMAYQNRAELRVEASRLDAARLEERIRWGELIPHADVVLEMGKLGEAFEVNSLDPGLRNEFRLQLEVNWNAMGNTVGYEFENREQAPSVSQFQQGQGSQSSRNTLSVGLFDGLAQIRDAKEAQVQKLEQIVELEQKEKEVILDVKQSYFDFQKAKIQVQSSVQRVHYRKRLAELAEFRLGKNEIQISEYLQSEIDLLQELRTLHTALADYFTAKAKMNHAIGVADYFPIEEQYGS